MTIFLVATILSMLMANSLSVKGPMPVEQGKRIKTMFRMLVAFFPLWAISVIRWNVLPDTCYPGGSYYYDYLYLKNHAVLYWTEPLFDRTLAIMTKLEIPWFFVLAIYSSFTVITFAWFIWKHSCSPEFSILLYTLLGLLLFPMGLLRQGVAEAFILMAYDAILDQTREKKIRLYRVYLFLLLGTLSHNSTVMVAGALFIAWWLSKKELKFIKITVVAVATMAASPILQKILIKIMARTRFRAAGDLQLKESAPSLFLLALFCILSVIPVWQKVKQLNAGYQLMVAMLYVFAVVMAYSSVWTDPFRVIHMFTPIIIILAPLIRKFYSTRVSRVLYTLAYVIVAGLLFWRTMDGSDVVYHSVFELINF